MNTQKRQHRLLNPPRARYQNKYVIRSLRKGETDLLKDFLYEAIFIPKERSRLRGTSSRSRNFVCTQMISVPGKAITAWWLISVAKVVGAVWTRIMDDYGMWMMRHRPSLFRFIRNIAVRASAHSLCEDARTAEMAGI